MIIRRFAAAIRRQDWFQVLIEVLIVIVGIFLGLQVQGWYEERLANEEEKQVLGNLISEMERTLEFYDFQMPRYELQISNTSKVIDILQDGKLDPEDVSQFEDGIFRFGRLQVLDPYVSAFSAENLVRIQNRALRTTVDNYLGVVRINKTRLANISRRVDQARALTTTKAGVRQHINREYSSYYDFEKLRHDKDFIAAVVNINNFEILAMRVMEAVRLNSISMLDALNKYQQGDLTEPELFSTMAPTDFDLTREVQ